MRIWQFHRKTVQKRIFRGHRQKQIISAREK